MKFPSHYHVLDLGSSSHLTPAGKSVDFDSSKEGASFHQAYFHTCNGRALLKSDKFDLILYYPLGLLPKEYRSESFLQRFQEIMGHLGGLGIYEGIHKPKLFQIHGSTAMGCATPIMKDNVAVSFTMDPNNWIKGYNEVIQRAITSRKDPNFGWMSEISASNYYVQRGQSRDRVPFSFEEDTEFTELDNPNFVYWRIPMKNSLSSLHTYYSCVLVRALFSAHYRPAIVNMMKVKQANPKFKWFTCLQIANYSRDTRFKVKNNISSKEHGYYFYYWTNNNSACKIHTMITKEQLFELFQDRPVVVKANGNNIKFSSAMALNSTFSNPAMIINSDKDYYSLAELFTKEKYKEIYDIIRQEK